MGNRPLRVVLWCAVSTKPQAGPDKVSLPEQERAGREFAAGVGGEVVDVLTDPGESRSIILWQDAEAAIPAYRQLRQHCESHDFDVLHTLTSDRLGRTQALMAQVYGLVAQAGAEVYDASAPHPIGQATIANRYVAAIRGVQAEAELVELRRRHRSGMRGRIKRGLHASNWPLGYSVVRDDQGDTVGAELVPEEAAAVRFATRRFLAGAAFATIAEELDAAGYPTQRGGEWRDIYVYSLMHNDTYAGFPAWGSVRPEQPSERYPHLWTPDTYARVVAERRRRGRATHTRTALMDVAFCNRCGGRMTRSAYRHGDNEYVYLHCGGHASRAYTCHANNVPEATVQEAVVAFLTQEFADSGRRWELAQSHAGPADSLRAEVDALETELSDVAERRQRIANALASGQMDVQMYRATDDALLEQLDGVNAALSDLEAQLDATPTPEGLIETYGALYDALDTLWQMPPEEACALLQAAGVRVLVEEREVVGVALISELYV